LVLVIRSPPERDDSHRPPARSYQVVIRRLERRGFRSARIVEGLERAIAWTRGENGNVRVRVVHVPEVDVRAVRTKMDLSQAQFATKFGFPPATLRNWEQGRSRPDAPNRVLLAVIAKHPEAVEDVLGKAVR
jgi:putative transcriptional regulator